MRLRRLRSDYDAVRQLVRRHPKIDIEGVAGSPPEKYRLVLHVQSLRERGDEVIRVHDHRLEIALPKGYPRDPPMCRMLTPVFHPNIAPHAVCVGDHWTAAETLALLIQRVGEMLAFQSYNTKSPLNGKAAKWVDEHVAELPIDAEEFFVDLSSDREVGGTAAGAGESCANCGAGGQLLATCQQGHHICGDCSLRCQRCGRLQCLACGEAQCPDCSGECSNCGEAAVDPKRCAKGHALCEDCTLQCPTCGRLLCLTCGEVSCESCQAGCSNCGQPASKDARCQAGHLLCSDCAITCLRCGKVLCLICGVFACPDCS